MQFKRHDGLLSAILSTITCGIYSIYFWYVYGEEVNVICEDDGKVTQNYVVAWVLGIITCGIYSLYWLYNVGSRLDTASKKYGVNVESPVFFTLFMSIPFLSYFYACDVMNKFQQKYEEMYVNGRPMGPNGGGNGGAYGSPDLGSQFKSAFHDIGSSIKSTAQSAMTVCPNCGETVAPGKNYCKKCGYPVRGQQEAPQRPMQSTAPEPVQEPMRSAPQKPAQAPQEPAPSVAPQPAQPIPEAPATPDICPKCGSPAKAGDKFCIRCGARLN